MIFKCRWSKSEFQAASELFPSGEEVVVMHPLVPTKGMPSHIARNVGKSIRWGNGIVGEKLFCLKNPFKRVCTIELGQGQFRGFNGFNVCWG